MATIIRGIEAKHYTPLKKKLSARYVETSFRMDPHSKPDPERHRGKMLEQDPLLDHTVEEGNFEHLFNFEANLKICQIFFHHFFLA
jgi:hypothetical protein